MSTKERIRLAIITFGGCGLVPFAPGTVGSAGALGVALLLDLGGWGSTPLLLLLAAVASALTIALGPWIATKWPEKDPRYVVLDEVAGQWVALAVPLRTENPWLAYPLAFFLFRLFDVLKPFGARRLEKLPGAWGILLDDLLVAFYVALILWGLGTLMS